MPVELNAAQATSSELRVPSIRPKPPGPHSPGPTCFKTKHAFLQASLSYHALPTRTHSQGDTAPREEWQVHGWVATASKCPA